MPPCAPSEQCIEKRRCATIRQMLDLLSRTVHAVFDKPATGRITSLETLMRVSYLKRHSKPHACHPSNLSRFRVCRYTWPSGGGFSSLIPETRRPDGHPKAKRPARYGSRDWLPAVHVRD